MHKLKQEWRDLAEKNSLNMKKAQQLLMKYFCFQYLKIYIFIILEEITKTSRKYHLTWKLQKCRWFPDKVKFEGVNISIKGNTPSKSNMALLSD